MHKNKPTRVGARGVLGVVPAGLAAGTAIGLALGGAYLAGGMARDAKVHSRVVRVAEAANDDFSLDSLRQLAEADPAALSAALRYDPALLGAYSQTDRRSAEFAGKLAQRTVRSSGQSSLFKQASYGVSNPAARPYHGGALDQSRELDCLTQAVYFEARGETPAGQAAVAQVVLNRVRHPSFPKTVCGVVFQGAQAGRGCQFSFACDGSTNRSKEPKAWSRAERVATRAMDGYVMAEVGNATHFHVTGLTPGWRNMLMVSQIGAHVFYRFGGRNGAPNAFSAEPREDLVASAEPLRAAVLVVSEAVAEPLGMGGPLGPATAPADAPELSAAKASAVAPILAPKPVEQSANTPLKAPAPVSPPKPVVLSVKPI